MPGFRWRRPTLSVRRTPLLRAPKHLLCGCRADARIARGQLVRLAQGGELGIPRDASASGETVERVVGAAIDDETGRVASGTLPAVPDLAALLAAAPALRLALQDVVRARAAQTVALAQQRPTITPSVGLQKFSTDRGVTLGPTLGLSLSLPRTAPDRAAATAAVASREVALAEATARATRLRVATALNAAADRYEAARGRITTYDAALLRGAREEREAALASYRAGGLTLLELLDFERALAQAEITRMQSRIDAIDAQTDLLLIALGADDLADLAASSAAHAENDR